jgi:hypothetical protein
VFAVFGWVRIVAWWTYESLLCFTKTLEELISDLKPRDNIDMQSFIFCIGECV